MIPFLEPVEHFGLRFDRGSILFEFDALREPERTQFPQIGHYLRARGVEFNEVPTPKMLWGGKLWPDLFIANQLEAAPEGWNVGDIWDGQFHPDQKFRWRDSLSLWHASVLNHGEKFHDAFIEPMVRKIAGRASSEIAAKFHRSIWMPIFWPTTLRSRKSIPTKFHYPKHGYAGCVADLVQSGSARAIPRTQPAIHKEMDGVAISVAYCLAHPLQTFSVAFIVDDSPIYRVTDQEVCAGIDAPLHRLIVEYRGECDVWNELQRLGLADAKQVAYGSARLQLPTLANVKAGWTPRPHINAQLWEIINGQK